MGLLDSVLSSVMGGGAAGSPIAGVLSNLLGGQQGMGGQTSDMAGGLGGLVARFEQAGLGQLAQSWVGNGPNQAVSPQQLQSVFGVGQVQSMANQSGMPQQDFLSQLSQHLPNIIHGMTPNGSLPTANTVSV